MEKSVFVDSKEHNFDELSAKLSSDLQIGNITVEKTHKITHGTDKFGGNCSKERVGNIFHHYDEIKQKNVTYTGKYQTDNHVGNINHLELDASVDFTPVTRKIKKTRENHASRKKVKDYNIISISNSVARQPIYFKLDKSSTSLLELLVKHRLVAEYHNVIGNGTNSLVIHANCYGKYHNYFPCGNAVKVYKIYKDEEKNRAICKHAQREIDLLYTLSTRHSGNNFPHPVYRTKNIIVMSFIGNDQETAPSIATVPSEHLQETYHSIVKEMDLWYNKLNIVHGNLSSKTILYWLGKLYYIGWSHFVLKDHPKALIKLMRDCQFVTKHFESCDVPVKSTEELFKDITGHEDITVKVLEVINTKNSWQDQHQTNPNRKSNNGNKLSRNFRFK